MISKTDTYFMGYRLLIDRGVNLKPRWYDLPRRLGFRKRVKTYATPKDAVLLSNANRFMTVRDEDYNNLLNSPDFPRPPERDPLAPDPEPDPYASIGARRMGLDTIRNAQ